MTYPRFKQVDVQLSFHIALWMALLICWPGQLQGAPSPSKTIAPISFHPRDGGAIHQTFPIPEALLSNVRFWRDLFLLYPSNQVVLHDKESMDIIWQVAPLPTTPQGNVDERRSSFEQRRLLEQMRQRLLRLEATMLPQDAIDEAILSKLGDRASIVLPGAASRLRLQRGVADHFEAGMDRARQWLPEIRDILQQEGVPEAMAALPFVESMFNPKARSAAGAVGLWQLMPSTARGLGLKVSRRGADERSHVLKATKAAAKMLKQNYRMLGSWPLAITAYNHGPNGVRRAVQQVGSDDLMVLIDQYEKNSWGFASKNFYAEFLAVLSVLTDTPVQASRHFLEQQDQAL